VVGNLKFINYDVLISVDELRKLCLGIRIGMDKLSIINEDMKR